MNPTKKPPVRRTCTWITASTSCLVLGKGGIVLLALTSEAGLLKFTAAYHVPGRGLGYACLTFELGEGGERYSVKSECVRVFF